MVWDVERASLQAETLDGTGRNCLMEEEEGRRV